MSRITLKNSFHGTEVVLNMKSTYPSAYQVKRSWRTLCGVKGCTCGDIMGMRGPQDVDIVGQEYLYGELIPALRPKQ